jgi:membrane protein DedA with SNARE-associated domain
MFLKLLWHAKTPLGLLALLLVIHAISWVGIIPDTAELTEQLSRFFDRFGLPAVAICSFLENVAGFGIYFPGSIVMVTAMALSAGNPGRALATFFCIVLPAVVAHHLDYVLGRYADSGRSSAATTTRQPPTRRKSAKMWLWFFSTLWQPNLAATTSLICGNEGIPYLRFIRYYAVVAPFWTITWGTGIYLAGSAPQSPAIFVGLFYVYLGLWIIHDCRRFLRQERKTPP